MRVFLPEAKRSWCLSGELVVNVSGHWVVVVLAHLQVVVVDPRDGSLPGGVAVPSGHDVKVLRYPFLNNEKHNENHNSPSKGFGHVRRAHNYFHVTALVCFKLIAFLYCGLILVYPHPQ